MSEYPRLQWNHAGGIDLLAERDAGNPVLILTGKPECSIKFWETVQELAAQALDEIQIKQELGL